MVEQRDAPAMRVDVWSDIACPWCWLGKRHLEQAIERLGLEGAVEVELHSFELQPHRKATEPAKAYLEERMGTRAQVDAVHQHLAAAGERAGVAFDFEAQLVANTFDAHRVHHLAKARGKGGAVVERFLAAYHGEGADLADHGTIRRLAVEAGLDGGAVDEVLGSDAYGDAVRRDQSRAASMGVAGVPFFLIAGRYAVSGAQPVDVFARALQTAMGGAEGGE